MFWSLIVVVISAALELVASATRPELCLQLYEPRDIPSSGNGLQPDFGYDTVPANLPQSSTI